MPLTTAERNAMIDRYERGPALLKAALAKVPKEALQWRPAPGRWSAHEIILHCADSEANGSNRIRYLFAEETPVLQGYNQDRWATQMQYHQLPLEPALATVEAVRANTVPLLRRATDDDWTRSGTHSERGPFGGDDWLKLYAEHLEKHSRQIEGNLAAWKAR